MKPSPIPSAIENDSGVQAICDMFGTEIDKERVRPVD